MARERAEEIISSDIGAILDGNQEQENDECDEEGIHEHPELFVKDPAGIKNDLNCDFSPGNIYRRIELETNEDLNSKAQRLDVDQSLVL